MPSKVFWRGMRATSEEAIVVLTVAGGLLFYAVGITSGSQLGSDDVLYAQMAREMLQRGNLFDNSWLGVTHLEKPPLLLWCLGGVSETKAPFG